MYNLKVYKELVMVSDSAEGSSNCAGQAAAGDLTRSAMHTLSALLSDVVCFSSSERTKISESTSTSSSCSSSGPSSSDATTCNVPSTSSSSQPTARSSKEEAMREYVEQKYGSSSSHVNLSREEVDAMVNKALQDSPTVTYLLQSLKQVIVEWGLGGGG